MKGIKKHKKLVAILIILIILIVIVVVAMFKFISNRKKIATSVMKVSTVSLEKMDLVKSISATGTLESKTSNSVTATSNNMTVKTIEVSVASIVSGTPKILLII